MRKTQWIIGIDEVGRGPLAGPITVAAVAAPFMDQRTWSMEQSFFAGIRDSKKLTALQRESWSKKIRGNYIFALASVSSRAIDKRGISVAVRLAVSRCLIKMSKCFLIHDPCSMIMLDGGLYAPPEYKNQQTIIRGDENHPLIAAASIVAKVHRDRYMARLHKKLPQYGFDKHKGYGTQGHIAMLKKYGLSAAHRASFCRFV